MSKPPLLNIQMVPAGVELVITALSKLPFEQVAGLISEIAGQAAMQQHAAEQKEVEPAQPQPTKGAPKK